ncbi:TrsK protein, partial [Bacillus sp. SIMBA_161]
MMKKTLQKGAGKKIAVTFLLSLLIGYALTGLLRFLKEGGGLNALLLDVQGTLTFLTETDQQSQLLVAILTIVFFGWFLSKMRLVEHTY